MDFSRQLKELLSSSGDIQGAAYFTADGVLISELMFGSKDAAEYFALHCASATAIASQLMMDANYGDFEAFVVEGEGGYVILMPVMDETILGVLVRKDAKLGLVLLDMRNKGSGGTSMAGEFIIPPRPPKRGGAHARPEDD